MKKPKNWDDPPSQKGGPWTEQDVYRRYCADEDIDVEGHVFASKRRIVIYVHGTVSSDHYQEAAYPVRDDLFFYAKNIVKEPLLVILVNWAKRTDEFMSWLPTAIKMLPIFKKLPEYAEPVLHN